MLKSTIFTILIWAVCLLKFYLHADFVYPFKTIIDLILLLVAGLVSFFAIKKALTLYKADHTYKQLSPLFATVLGVAALFLTWFYLVNRDRAASILYATRTGNGFESTTIDLRRDSTYKITIAHFLTKRHLRGTYRIKDSLIFLDEAYPSYNIPGTMLILRQANNAVGEEKKNLIHQLFGDKAASQPQRYELVVISQDGTSLLKEQTFKVIDKL